MMTRNTGTQLRPAYGSLLLAVTIAPKVVGQRIKSARDKKLWTQMDFANEANVSLSTVQRWEAGKLPSIRELFRIADLLEVDAAEFVEMPEEPATEAIMELRAMDDAHRLDHADVVRRLEAIEASQRQLMAVVQRIESRVS